MRITKNLFMTTASFIVLFALIVTPYSVAKNTTIETQKSETVILASNSGSAVSQVKEIVQTAEKTTAPLEQTVYPVVESKNKVVPLKESETSTAPQTGDAVISEATASGNIEKAATVPQIKGRTFLTKSELNGIIFDIYLEDIGDGLKEIVLEYNNLLGERKVLKPGIVYDEVNQLIYGKKNKGLLGSGFDLDYGETAFYYAPIVFQRNYGYCELYDDLSFLIFDDLITARMKFNYEGRDWMIQIWKGRYLTTIGGEMGIYNKPESRGIEFYDCGRDEDAMPMSMSILRGEEVYLEMDLKTWWWQTGFVFRELCAPEELTMKSKIVFPNETMSNLFTGAIDKMPSAGIIYTVTGNAVSFVW